MLRNLVLFAIASRMTPSSCPQVLNQTQPRVAGLAAGESWVPSCYPPESHLWSVGGCAIHFLGSPGWSPSRLLCLINLKRPWHWQPYSGLRAPGAHDSLRMRSTWAERQLRVIRGCRCVRIKARDVDGLVRIERSAIGCSWWSAGVRRNGD